MTDPPRTQRTRPATNGILRRPKQHGLRAINGKLEPRLVSDHKLGVDASEQPAIEQRAVLLALRQVDAVAAAERVEAAWRARMPA